MSCGHYRAPFSAEHRVAGLRRPLAAISALLLLAVASIGYGCGADGITLRREGETLRFSTSEATAVIETEPFRLSLALATDQVMADEEPGGLRFSRGEQEIAVGAVLDFERSGRTLRLEVEAGGESGTVLLTWLTDRTLKVEFEPPNAATVTALSDAYRLTSDELIYGLSERVGVSGEVPIAPDAPLPSEYNPQETGSLNRRGEVVEMFVLPTQALYAPFYHSSAGYGLYVEGTTPGEFDVGATDPDALRFRFEAGTTPESRTLRYNLFVGPDHATILDEYTALTGQPFVPPEWAFRHWRWRDELVAGQTSEIDDVDINAEVAEDIAMYEKYNIPSGVYIMDRPWTPGEYGFASFQWDQARIPNAGEMLEILKERGFHVVVWTTTWALGDRPDDNRPEAAARGYFAPNSDRTIDLTNPEAWAWWKAKHVDFTRRWGISGWRLDRGEEHIPSQPSDIWADGRTGREIHNVYPLLQAQLMHEAMREARGDDFVVIARSGYPGAQRYEVFWIGDAAGSTFFGSGPGTDLGLRNTIISMQRAGFMGFPIWGSDAGGYYEFKERDVFARWLQFSAFTPIMEIGGKGSHAPWDMPTEPKVDTEMIEIYRRYVQLHHDLIPYTMEHAKVATKMGLPIARALAFDFPGDPEVLNRWDQFMYGDDLLVAPVWRTGARSRDVYLPEGQWEDFWDRDQVFEGPTTIRVDAPLDKIPVFVRAGAEIPGRPE